MPETNNVITLSAWFELEELTLMRQCLEAVVSENFFDDELLHTLTGWGPETFRELLERFDHTAATASTTREDYEVVSQAVAQLCNYPIARPDELEALLGIPLLHLGWFWYRLWPMRENWNQYAEDDANAVRRAALSRP